MAIVVGSSFIFGGLALADSAPPTSETAFFFEQAGQHVTQPVDFTVTCSGPDRSRGSNAQFQKFSLKGVCPAYGCKVDTSTIFADREAITSCSIEGSVGGSTFRVNDFLGSSLNRLTCQASYNIGTDDKYYLFTPQYQACVDVVRKKYDFAGEYTCHKFSKVVTKCPAGERCMMIGNKTLMVTEKTDACNAAELAEEKACLAQATDVTATAGRRKNGYLFDDQCTATIAIPATVLVPVVATSSLQAVASENTSTMNATSVSSGVQILEETLFGRLMRAIGCFFATLFGGSCE